MDAVWSSLERVLGVLIYNAFHFIFHLMAGIVIGLMQVLPIVSLGELDLSPVLSQLDFAGWFLPYAALGIITVQWVSLIGFSLVTFFVRLGLKGAALGRGGAW